MTEPVMPDKVEIDVDRDGCMAKRSGFTISIGTTGANGYGHGYRIAGPKFCSLGNNEHVLTATLDERDAREIFQYIRPLLGDDWLFDQMRVSSTDSTTTTTEQVDR